MIFFSIIVNNCDTRMRGQSVSMSDSLIINYNFFCKVTELWEKKQTHKKNILKLIHFIPTHITHDIDFRRTVYN